MSVKSEKFNFGKISFDNVNFQESLRKIFELADQGKVSHVVTANTDFVVKAETDNLFVDICRNADLVIPDGMPIVWASRILKPVLEERVAGSDMVYAICKQAAVTGHRIFLLGGMPGDAEKAKTNLELEFPAVKIVGTYCPPFGFEDNLEENGRIIQMIKESQSDIIMVGVGAPKQEKWITQNRNEFQKGVFIGVGISIAFCAGTVKRAPKIMQKTGFEWFYRAMLEPKRLGIRYLKDFYILVIFVRQLLKR